MLRRQFLKFTALAPAVALPVVQKIAEEDSAVAKAFADFAHVDAARTRAKEERAGRYGRHEITAAQMVAESEREDRGWMLSFDRVAEAKAASDTDLKLQARALRTVFPRHFERSMPSGGTAHDQLLASILNGLVAV